MKFYSSKIDSVLTQIHAGKIKSLLLYGPNKGLICQTLDLLVAQNNFQVSSISSKEIEANSHFNLILNTKNFFNQRELVKIINVAEGFNLDILADTLDSCWHFPVFIADDLNVNSKIRKFFEAQSHVAIMPCYNEESQSIVTICIKFFTQHKKKLTQDALEYLKTHLQGDSLMVRSELEKILYYNIDQSTISLESVIKIISGNLTINYDLFCNYFISNNTKSFLEELDKIGLQNVNNVTLIRTITRYFVNLLIATLKLEAGESLDEVINSFSPPIFYKYVESFKKLVFKYNSDEIINIVGYLQEAEIEAKLFPEGNDLFQSLFFKNQ